jgi:hypothetical protein
MIKIERAIPTQNPASKVVAVIGPPGRDGTGTGTLPDPGDLTVLFENGLI